MKVPAQTLRFAQTMIADPAEIELAAVQAHVIKHPFGMAHLMSPWRSKQERVWNGEGWDRLEPPVLTLAQRRQMTAAIAALEVAEDRCKMPRLSKERFGGDVPPKWERHCYECPAPVAGACAVVTRPVEDAYARVIDETLAMVADPVGEVVLRAELEGRVMERDRTLDGLAILTVGLTRTDDAKPVARITRWDGVRVELKLDHGVTLLWRTCYRELGPTRPARLGFLLQGARSPVGRPLPLSEHCVVPRPWWQEHGSRS